MYCYAAAIKGEPVKYSMNEYLGKIDDFSFTTKPADYQRKALDVELAILVRHGITENELSFREHESSYRRTLLVYYTDKMQVTS